MLSNILQILTQAIQEKHSVAVCYHDQRQVRVLEPHAIYTDERGELVLDAYQVRGFSSSGRPPPFWRPLRLKKITSASLLRETFEPRVEEGFSGARLKYRNGLVAIVEKSRPAFNYPPALPSEMGPHPQLDRRRP